MQKQLVRLEHISFSFTDKPVIREIDCTIHAGEFVGIIGPNGTGKTTLLRLISGYLKPDRGAILLMEREIRLRTPEAIAQTLAVVPQTEVPVFPFTVTSMVMLGRHPHLSGMGFESPEDRMVVSSVMELTGINHLANRNVMELSGGEFHRVTIARALAQDTPLLLLDEPTAHLDVQHQGALFDLFAHLVKHRGRTVICVTHDLNLAATYCDRILLVSNGQLAADAPPAEVIDEPLIRKHFGPQLSIAEIDGRRILYPVPGDQTFSRFDQPYPKSSYFHS